MSDQPIVFYHRRDLDGQCSGAIAGRAVSNTNGPSVACIGYDYGESFDLAGMKGRQVHMLDVSLASDVMVELATVSRLTWIDHHEVAINEVLAKIPLRAMLDGYLGGPGSTYEKQAACEIAWRWYNPDIPVPESVRLLSVYDAWVEDSEYDWEEHVMPFQYWARAQKNLADVYDPMWDDLLHGEVEIDQCIKLGRLVYDYVVEFDERYAKANAFDTLVVAGGRRYNAVAINRSHANSQLFRSVFDPARHDLMVSFCRGKRGTWLYSVYSTKAEVHCGEICKLFGGGGHRGAAGFELPYLIF
jgi:uncharacterized protein